MTEAWLVLLLAQDWPTLQQNNRRTGYASEAIAPPYTEVWRHDFEEMIDVRVQPIVAEGVVLVPTYKGRLHALDARTGAKRWVFEAQGPFFSSPSVADGRVFISCQDRNVYAVDLKTGTKRWAFETGEGVHAAPAVEEGKAYVGSHDGVFYALDAATGRKEWEVDLGKPVLTTAAVSGDALYVAAEDLHAYALARGTGAVLWKSKMVGQSARSYWPVVTPHYVYFRTLPVRSWAQHPYNVKVDLKNPDTLARVRDLLSKDPLSQSFFAFHPKTGKETVFPVLWTAGGGTVPFPPVSLPGGRIATPAPSGERTSSSGSSSVSILDEGASGFGAKSGYVRVIADESYGYSAAGPWLFSSHHDYLQVVDTRKDPDHAKNTITILGKRDRPVDDRAAQWFGNHDNHPGWHAASLANGHVYWITQGSWLFVFKGSRE